MDRPPDVVVVLGGAGDPDLTWAGLVPAGTPVVAADSGLHTALALGLTVDHVVGDLDSVDLAVLARAEAAGTRVHRHPTDKDATDGELALDLAGTLVGVVPASPMRPSLLVLGPGAGRLDQLLADLLQLTAPRLAGLEVTARVGSAVVTVVHPGHPRRLSGSAGEQVSLLAVGGPVRGVTSTRLRWPLVDATLTVGTTRGISNELLGETGAVSVHTGVLLVVQPGTRAGE